MVELAGVTFVAPGGRVIVREVSARFAPGEMTVVLGPNGAGKSTLVRLAAGLLAPTAGAVRYGGRPLRELPARELARVRGVLTQHAEPAFPLAAEEVVEMGRYPHFDRVPGRRDREAVERALAAVDMLDRRGQAFATLSAGERQKVQLARVLAQMDVGGPASGAAGAPSGAAPGAGSGAAPGAGRVLFLDEPTTSLDVHHQLQIVAIARGLTAHGVTVIAVLHDLNLAYQCADRFLVLDGGRVAYAGARAAGLSEELVSRVYRVRARRVVATAGHAGEGGAGEGDATGGRALWSFEP